MTKFIYALLFTSIIVSGCILFRGNPTLNQKVYNFSYAIASQGTSEAIRANSGLSNNFVTAWTMLDAQLTATNLTGQGLRQFISTVPFKELKTQTAQFIISQETFLLDLSTGGSVNLETNLALIYSAGWGLRNGIGAVIHRP